MPEAKIRRVAKLLRRSVVVPKPAFGRLWIKVHVAIPASCILHYFGCALRRRQALQRTVAVKVLPQDLAKDLGRRTLFEKKARAAGALNRAFIVTVHNEDFIRISEMTYVRTLPYCP